MQAMPPCHDNADCLGALVVPAGGHSGNVDPEVTSAMIAKEQHKLEVLKRRQEREIQQVYMAGLAELPGSASCMGRNRCVQLTAARGASVQMLSCDQCWEYHPPVQHAEPVTAAHHCADCPASCCWCCLTCPADAPVRDHAQAAAGEAAAQDRRSGGRWGLTPGYR